jgi:WD40 repeat protein
VVVLREKVGVKEFNNTREQVFFTCHTDIVSAVCVHPAAQRNLVASAATGWQTRIMVWDTVFLKPIATISNFHKGSYDIEMDYILAS